MNIKIDFQDLKYHYKLYQNKILIFFKQWIDFIRIIFKRFFCGFKKVDFILYFIFVIILVGGLGVYPIALKYYEASILKTPDLNIIKSDFAKSLSTYFITIIATSSADLILSKHPAKHAQILKMPAVSCLIIGAISIFIIQIEVFGEKTLDFALWATIFSLLIWWITNSMDIKYDVDDNNSGEFTTSPLGDEIEPNSQIISDVELTLGSKEPQNNEIDKIKVKM